MKSFASQPRLLWVAAITACAVFSTAAANVTLAEDNNVFTLANGIVTARIEKRTGTLVSLKYQELELLDQESSGASGGYWSSVGRARPGGERRAIVRIDPTKNGGKRAEISCEFHNEGQDSPAPLDVDIRYSLGRGESWLYACEIWNHKSGYPGFSTGEARYAMKLNPDVFDYMTIDKDRRRVMPTPEDWDKGEPLNLKEARRMTTGVHKGEVEHKYDYSAVLYETPAYGWSSTKHKLGLWIVNPSMEYIAGGPTKAELTGHLDVNPGASPTLLNMWLGSHYGGTSLAVGTNENWTKVIGPFLIYCNSANDHEALWADALARAAKESKRWPYSWLSDPDYSQASARTTVSGQIVVKDLLAPNLKFSNMWVGVTAPNFTNPVVGFGGGGRFGRGGRTNSFGGGRSFTNFAGRFNRGFPPYVDWQRDSKYYQFWVRADAKGRFKIPNVRPGNYWMRAIADGVLGELDVTNVTVAAGKKLSLGEVAWNPTRYGRTVWEIGIPDRTAREYRHGDHYWQWGLYYEYPNEFPNDVNFVIGKSDWRKDWNYVQPPRIEDRSGPMVGEDEEEPNGADSAQTNSVRRRVQSTTWSITFDMAGEERGTAVLRLAFCGTHAGCNVEVFVNDQSVGETGPLPPTSAMQRDGIRAYWVEKPIKFDAAMLKPGTNVIKLLSHANSWSQGVMYDYVRLEMAEAAPSH